MAGKSGSFWRTAVNSDVLSGLKLGEVEKIQFKSNDGILIEGFVIKPPGFVAGKQYPVVQPNPRGSTGYGQAFCMAIWQDWGGPDYFDVMASVDEVISRGWADPDRMGVTGWSYDGILTNHVITKTDRFKAAATGASAT